MVDEIIDTTLARAGTVHIALAGGTTPKRAYEMLASMRTDWSGVHLWFGDERLVPLASDDANARMVAAAFAGPAGVGPERIHGVPTNLGGPGACHAYAAALRAELPEGPGGLPVLDLALLGLGEDGHTASLFPNSDLLHVTGKPCGLVDDAPKPPPNRLTLTMAMLNAAHARIVLATGTGKAEAVSAAFAQPDDRAPASLLAPDTVWILDRAAAAALEGGDDA
jgi:6-phosphogluconolactonase